MSAPVVAASTLLASALPLDAALDRVAALGFDTVDLPLQEKWAHSDPSALADDEERVASRIERLLADRGLVVRALNAAAGAVAPAEERRRVAALLRLAEGLGAGVITLPSGSADTPFDALVERATLLVALAEGSRVAVTFETHRFTPWEDPEVVVRTVEAVPGLGVTLDAAHFAAGPHWGRGFADVLPHVRHVHLRAAGSSWDEIQLPAGTGRIELGRHLDDLAAVGYAGVLAVEYVDTIPGVDHGREARRMADLVRAHRP